ncbi:MAG TPA: hypothetical protein VIL20_27365 [Sandaracinaceae bacterium]
MSRARRRSTLGLALALLFAPAGPAPARADEPVDVPERDEAALEAPLPDAPAGFRREEAGDVVWEYHERTEAIARELIEVHREAWPRIAEELGGVVDGSLVVRIARSPEEMAALAPIGQPPPPYASGVAYPRRGLVLLTLTAPETWQRPDVDRVLVHELSHVALHRAVNGHPIPRWFSEGVAIHQAGEHSLERLRTLWSGAVSGRLLPMEELSRGFDASPHRVNLAYAQSADFVRWLLARDDGEAQFTELIERLGRGQPFETAFALTYSVSLRSLEIAWHDDLAKRFQAWPLLFGSGSLWALAALLIVIAYVRRKRKDQETLREWEKEEQAVLAAARILVAPPEPEPPVVEPFEDRDVLYIIPPEPLIRDSGVPTIEHDGRSHTLH